MDQQTIDYLAQRQGTIAHWLVWLVARDRSNDEPAPVGFWDGADHQAFTIGGDARTYFGAGALLEVEPIRQQVGLGIRVQQVSLTLTPDAQQAVRVYDPSLAPVEIHRAHFDPVTGGLVAEPSLAFAGTVDVVTITEGATGQPSTITLEIVGKERALTRRPALFKSDAALRARPGAEDDTFRQHAGEAPRWITPWGERAVAGGGSSGSAATGVGTSDPVGDRERYGP